MNHLHKLIDCLRSDDVSCVSESMDLFARLQAKRTEIIECGRKSIAFHLGDGRSFGNPSYLGIPNMPFEKIFVEFGTNESSWCLLCDGPMNVFVFNSQEKGKRFYFFGHFSASGIYPADDRAFISSLVGQLWFLIHIINCSNVHLKLQQPPKKKIKPTRKNRDPEQAHSWYTLHFTPTNSQSHHDGDGSRSAPRVHLRRGHIRVLKSKKNIWVQPCIVGDPERGMIHKDYRLRDKTIDA